MVPWLPGIKYKPITKENAESNKGNHLEYLCWDLDMSYYIYPRMILVKLYYI